MGRRGPPVATFRDYRCKWPDLAVLDAIYTIRPVLWSGCDAERRLPVRSASLTRARFLSPPR